MRIPPSLLLGLGRFLLFILLEAACIYMVSHNGIVQKYRLIGKLREVQGFFWEKYSAINGYTSLRETNVQLALENTHLLNQLYNKDDSTLAHNQKYPFTFIDAKVIRNTIGTTHNYLIIDKGSKDGIAEDMGVITPMGTIGITRAVTENYTYVISFLNTNQQVSARIGKEGAFGPLSWNPQHQGRAILEEIPQHLQINRNDTIYTSGYSSFYPPDIPIGIVEDSRLVNGVHLNLDIRLLQDFRSINHVMVVKNNNKEELDKLIKKAKDK